MDDRIGLGDVYSALFNYIPTGIWIYNISQFRKRVEKGEITIENISNIDEYKKIKKVFNYFKFITNNHYGNKMFSQDPLFNIDRLVDKNALSIVKYGLNCLISNNMPVKYNVKMKNLLGSFTYKSYEWVSFRENTDFLFIIISENNEIKDNDIYDLISDEYDIYNNEYDFIKMDNNYIITDVKTTLLNKLGYTKNELIGKHARLIMKIDNIMEQTSSKQTAQIHELKHKNGNIKVVKGVIERNDNYLKIIYLNEKLEDKLELQIYQLSNAFGFIIDNMPIAMLIVDKNGFIKEVRGNASLKINLSQNMIGKSIYTFRDKVPSIFNPLIRSLSGISNISTIEYGEYYFELFIQPLWDLDNINIDNKNNTKLNNMINGAIMLLLDVTDRKNAEKQLFLSQKMEALGRLAGAINHDFNNILLVIQAYLDMALLENDPESIKSNLIEIQKATDRAKKLTSQLSAFSRNQGFDSKTIELNETIKNFENLLYKLTDETNVNLIINYYKEPLYIYTDRDRFEQAIINLIINANEATYKDGTILLKLYRETIQEVIKTPIDSIYPGEYVHIFVKDSGIGIKKDELHKIFEPFYSTKVKGTGLGLSIVFGLVRQSNGAINVESQYGAGTTFHMYFPIATEQLEIKSENIKKADNNHNNKQLKILLVDDDEKVLNAIAEVLEANNYKIYKALGSINAIKIWKNTNNQIDLVITDIIMPQLNGVELVRRMSEMNPNIKYIYISGYAGTYLKDKGILIDRRYLLKKPFTKDELMLKIKDVL